jgi:hypothetical protein
MSDEFDLRLRNLSSSAVLRPADERAVAGLHIPAVSSRRRNPVRLAIAAVVVLVAIMLANVAGAYYAPRYQRALADSGVGPISQRVLGAFGLNHANVTTVGDSATSSGHTVSLAAGYADGLRTVLFFSIDGRGLTGDQKRFGMNPGDYGIDLDAVRTTDQFGRTYGFGTGVTGPNELLYEPLPWPASGVGARLTVHITGLTAIWLRGAQPVAGDWTLHATLISGAANVIALPAPVHTAQADYVFTGITASETELVMHWTLDSPLNDQFRNPPTGIRLTDPMANPVVQQYFTPRVYDAGGRELQWQDYGYEWPKRGPALGEMTVYVKGPGRYRIQIAAVADSRWVVVP